MNTSSNPILIAAFFTSHSDAAEAVRDLQQAGFRSDQEGSSYEDYDDDSVGGSVDRDLRTDSSSGKTDHQTGRRSNHFRVLSAFGNPRPVRSAEISWR